MVIMIEKKKVFLNKEIIKSLCAHESMQIRSVRPCISFRLSSYYNHSVNSLLTQPNHNPLLLKIRSGGK